MTDRSPRSEVGILPRERAVELHAAGLRAPTIARQLGVAKNTVYRWLDPDYAANSRRLSLEAKKRRTGACVDCGVVTHAARHGGVAERCPVCAPLAARKFDHDRIIELRRRGMSQAQIAAAVGCAQAHVSEVLRTAGLGVGKGCGPGRGPKLVANA